MKIYEINHAPKATPENGLVDHELWSHFVFDESAMQIICFSQSGAIAQDVIDALEHGPYEDYMRFMIKLLKSTIDQTT